MSRASNPDSAPRLTEFRRKRSAGATPEPFGGSGAARPGLFVVQLHAARSLHWDLRLEIDGVLRSWAVPKGPSLDPGEKRLAVLTEDHPVEYGDFEGVIPEGQYGAGAMIVWDRGRWVPLLDPAEGLSTGKFLFELEGHKLRGRWTLVATRKKGAARVPEQWLLIKKPDVWATGEDAGELARGSVLSGLTVEELARGSHRAEEIRRELARSGAPRRTVAAEAVKPMHPEARTEPFDRSGWIFELKYDGFRALAACGPRDDEPHDREPHDRHDRGPRLLYRSGRDGAAAFPELRRVLAALPFESLILDGEVVVLDEQARPRFGRLQRRAQLVRRADIERAAVQEPAVYYAFDLLSFEDFDLRPLPLARRKEILRRVLPEAGPLRFADHIEERGEALFERVAALGVEGIVAKDAAAPYRGGRSAKWLKIRAHRSSDFVVVGFTRAPGARRGFRALYLGVLEGPRWVYAGRVSHSSGELDRRRLETELEALRRPDPPLAEAPRGRGTVWVEPRLVVEVRYLEVTAGGSLRHAVLVRQRDDKRPEECVGEGALPHGDEPELEVRPAPELPPRRPPFTPSHPEKVFWPEEGLTKGDLLAYYRTVARGLLPYLRDRPVVLDRWPDGIGGKSFFQKNAPPSVPEWVRTEAVWSEGSGKETRCFVCDDEETLLYLVNLGTIPLHVWASRFAALQTPDWSILDLDAKQATFAQVVEVARALRRLTRDLGLPSYVKTSGATGLHVLIPLGGRCTFEQARQLAELLARVVVDRMPDVASLARNPELRRGKVYVDCLQNGWGKLLAAPYAVRPLPGAPVSMPLSWREVRAGLDPKKFTLQTAPRRLTRWKGDPLRDVLTARPDLVAALARLAEWV